MIETEKTKSGLITLKYNNRYIHSKYDPIREAEQFAIGNSELLDKSIIVVYGLGLGYHIEAIAKKIKKNSILYVFEYNMELVKYCKEVNEDILTYNNVKIIIGNCTNFYDQLSECLKKAQDIIIHKPSLDTISSSNELLYNLINDYSLVKQSGKYNEELIKLGEENFESNKKLNYRFIEEFIEIHKSNKPYVITASGPSLDDELELLKKNREKFNIISVGSSLRALMNKGIKPDAVVIIDGKEIVKKQFEGYENECIPLCFAATASRWAVESYKGPKYIFNSSDEDKITIATRGTVAVSAIDISIKCGAEKIVFLGQDLAFVGDKSHTEIFEKVYGFGDNGKQIYKNKVVKSVDGGIISTTQGYISFKNKIESLIRNNEHVKFINCSKGAFINGAKHMDFDSFIENYQNN
ncbi:motility associated factor glycosyltransferase family protein [Clostridium beijerinckii]|uniref:motility associated factor glycosyltransferase family protein n=1 Tax=Clostridium beijerinckii TaxID=1520 RepID=UPI0015704C51|nr:6-hydroxymethylpterin diphosphokinase MptE-like protein [Clostridium beijerinckii]NRT73680.1 hypothetical protein [Clostridium beijerinckii]